MQEKSKSILSNLLLSIKNQIKEFISLGVPVLFADKIEAHNMFNVFFAFNDSIKHGFSVRSTQEFQSTDDKLQLEKRVTLLNFCLNSFKNGELLSKWYHLLSIVLKATKYVTEFNDSHHLSKIAFTDPIEDLFKEDIVVVEVESNVKLRLELLPNLTRLRFGHSKPNFILKVFVEFITIRGVLTNFLYFKIRIMRFTFSENVFSVFTEHLRSLRNQKVVLFLRVVNKIVVSKFYKELNVTGSSEMSVMYSRFRHL